MKNETIEITAENNTEVFIIDVKLFKQKHSFIIFIYKLTFKELEGIYEI